MRFDNSVWKKVKLGELFEITSVIRVHESDWTKEGIPFYRAREIVSIFNNEKIEPLHISRELYERLTKKCGVIEANNLLVTGVGTIGVPYLVKASDTFYFKDGNIIWLKNDKLNGHFLYYSFQTPSVITQIKNQCGTGTVGTYTIDSAKKTTINVPNNGIQEKIGNFLLRIDERIETQNKIIEDLKTLRKGIIDSLFASSEYEERLATFLQERKTYSEKGEGFEHVTLSKEGICAKTERYDRDFLVTTEDKNYKITKQNDICYNPANLKFGVICLNTYGDAIFSPIYVTFEVKNIDPYYLSLFLTSNRFIKKALRYQQGTVYERMAVNPEDFCKCKIPLNDNKTIQQTTKLVSLIDLKIKTEESIIQKYKTQKDYLLANLFI